MPLTDGFEFVVSDGIPRSLGVRKLNAKTFEIHPQTYALLTRLLDGHEEFRHTLAPLAESFEEVGRVLAALAEELGLPKHPDGTDDTEEYP